MRCIDTKDAVGHVLCHDITVIVKDVKKGVAFKKGHIVTEADIPELLKLGKDHLYVWEKDDRMLHEDEAAAILRDLCMGQNISAGQPSEGKIELTAAADGLFTVDSERMLAVNDIEEIMIASRHGMTPVHAGDKLAGTRGDSPGDRQGEDGARAICRRRRAADERAALPPAALRPGDHRQRGVLWKNSGHLYPGDREQACRIRHDPHGSRAGPR